jgi:hypothetical protein
MALTTLLYKYPDGRKFGCEGKIDRAIAQAVSRWLQTVEARFRNPGQIMWDVW